MESFWIKLAQREISICCNFAATREFCRDYRIQTPEDEEQAIRVTVDAQDIFKERREAEKEYGEAGALQFSDEYLETLAVYRKIADQMPLYGTILFHGSVVAVDGQAYLFTAKSGTGKSTHTALWRDCFKGRAVMINDDKPLLSVRDDGQVIAYGTPWQGKHGLGANLGMPLRGICVLERGKENEIFPLEKEQAFVTIYQQTYRPVAHADVIRRTLEILQKVMQIPLWRLKCNISKEAVRVAYEAMSGKRWEETDG